MDEARQKGEWEDWRKVDKSYKEWSGNATVALLSGGTSVDSLLDSDNEVYTYLFPASINNMETGPGSCAKQGTGNEGEYTSRFDSPERPFYPGR